MNNKRIILFLISTLTACEYSNSTRVCNHTRNEATLKLTFDTLVMNTWSGGMLKKNLTATFQNWGENLIPLDIDTVNYYAKFLIKPRVCGKIEGGMNRRPNFNFFKEIEIISEFDTIRLRTRAEMRKAFNTDRENPDYFFDLLLQEKTDR